MRTWVVLSAGVLALGVTSGIARGADATLGAVAVAAAMAGDSGVAARDSTGPEPALAEPTARSDSTLAALTRLFKYQVVARVWTRGRRYTLQNPRVLPEGVAYRRAIEPRRVARGELPPVIPWRDVDSLALRRTGAVPMGAAFGLVGGTLGALFGYAVGQLASPPEGALGAVVFGVPVAVVGFLGGGFLGGWVQRWEQVYPALPPAPDPNWRHVREPRARR